MVVFVEASVLEDPALARDIRFQGVRDRLQTFRDGTDDLQVIIERRSCRVISFSRVDDCACVMIRKSFACAS